MEDQLLRQHIASRAGRDRDQALKYPAAAGDDPDLRLLIFRFQNRRRIDLLILKEGERLLFPDHDRGKKGLDLLLKIPLHMPALHIGNGVEIHDLDSLLRHLAHDLLIYPILLGCQFSCRRQDSVDLLPGRHIGLILTNRF